MVRNILELEHEICEQIMETVLKKCFRDAWANSSIQLAKLSRGVYLEQTSEALIGVDLSSIIG